MTQRLLLSVLVEWCYRESKRLTENQGKFVTQSNASELLEEVYGKT
jgi:hypothetical protein